MLGTGTPFGKGPYTFQQAYMCASVLCHARVESSLEGPAEEKHGGMSICIGILGDMP